MQNSESPDCEERQTAITSHRLIQPPQGFLTIILSSTSVLYAFGTIITYYEMMIFFNLFKMDVKHFFNFTDVNLYALDIFARTILKPSSYYSIFISIGLYAISIEAKSAFKIPLVSRLIREISKVSAFVAIILVGYNYVKSAEQYFSSDNILSSLSLLAKPEICPAQGTDVQVALWRSSASVIVLCPKTRELLVVSNGSDMVYSFWPFERPGFKEKVVGLIFDLRTGGAFNDKVMKENLDTMRDAFNRKYARLNPRDGMISDVEFKIMMADLMLASHWIEEADADDILLTLIPPNQRSTPGKPSPYVGAPRPPKYFATKPLPAAKSPPELESSRSDTIKRALDLAIIAQTRPLCIGENPRGSVRLEIALDPSGNVTESIKVLNVTAIGRPDKSILSAYKNEALNGVRRGQPLHLPKEYYDLWKKTVLTIDMANCIGSGNKQTKLQSDFFKGI